MRRPPTHYEVLGVPADATAAQIRAAYRTAARRLHPDAGGAAADMRTLNAAWHVLSDPGRRAAYDRSLASGPGRSAPEAAGPPGPVPPGDPPERSAEWDDVYADLLDGDPIGPVRAPEGWWAVAPSAALMLAVAMAFGAVVFGSPALLVFAATTLFVSFGLFVLAPLRAMTRPRR